MHKKSNIRNNVKIRLECEQTSQTANYKKYLKFIPRYIFYKSVLQFKAYGRKTGVDG